MPEPWLVRGARPLLFTLTVAAYASSLASPFQFDDRGVITAADAVHSFGAFFADLGGGGLRPVLKASYALCWAFGGSSWPFHVFNLFLHLVNVELVLRLAVAAGTPARAPFSLTRSAAPSALASAVLFALHPLQTEAVTYVSGRSSSLAAAFVLLSLLFHVHGVRARSLGYRLVAAPLAFGLAVLTKETSAILPLGLLLWDALVERASLRELLRRTLPWCAVGAAALVFVVWHPGYFELLYAVVGQRSLADSLWHQLDGLRYLGARLLLVGRPCIDPGLWLGPGRFAAATGAALVLGLLLVAVWQRRALPVVAFGVGWFLLHTFVPYVLLPRIDVINERHAYVANAGLFLSAGALFQEWASTRVGAVCRAVAVLGTAALLLLTVRRNLEYRSEVSLWESTVSVAPQNPRAFNNLGVAYEKSGRRLDARKAYAQALSLEPRYAAARENLRRIDASR